MPTNNIKSKSGFTIIEVVLVLAVAGLIFLMVFIALPALQRSQRDTQRRQAVSQVHSALTQYQSNNSTKSDNLPGNGVCTITAGSFTIPTDATGANAEVCRFLKVYLNDGGTETTFVDPDGTAYNIDIKTLSNTDGNTEATGSDSFDHVMHIYRDAKCDGEKAVVGTGLRQFAILYRLEAGAVSCVDNS